MSKYTTQVRYICESYAGLNNSVGYDEVDSVIARSWEKIFDNDIPIFDENYRATLFTKILRHYYDKEIGFETVGLWKLKINTKLKEIMPYYNKLYLAETIKIEPLVNTSIEKSSKNTFNGNKNITDREKNVNVSNLENNNLSIYSDTPQGQIDNLENNGYMTEATKVNDISTGNTTLDITRDNQDVTTNIDDYIEQLTGFSGTSASELMIKYRESIINVDMLIINELKNLFMCLW